jgi:hypothetical protein
LLDEIADFEDGFVHARAMNSTKGARS